jgi:hypothetical protein
MMNTWLFRICCALAAAALLCGCAQSETARRVAVIAAGGSAPPDANDPSYRIDQYVIGEGTDFAEIQGDRMKQSGPYVYYRANKMLPGASTCSVYVYTPSRDEFGSCTFNATTLSAAKGQYRKWLANVQAAEPYWKELEVSPLPGGVLQATLFTDEKEIDGIYVSLASSGRAQYVTTVTFAKMVALRR